MPLPASAQGVDDLPECIDVQLVLVRVVEPAHRSNTRHSRGGAFQTASAVSGAARRRHRPRGWHHDVVVGRAILVRCRRGLCGSNVFSPRRPSGGVRRDGSWSPAAKHVEARSHRDSRSAVFQVVVPTARDWRAAPCVCACAREQIEDCACLQSPQGRAWHGRRVVALPPSRNASGRPAVSDRPRALTRRAGLESAS